MEHRENSTSSGREAVDEARTHLKRTRAMWRRGQIIEAATRLMERDGYHRVSIAAIAKEAGISTGLVYKYVDSKEALLLDVMLDILRDYTESVPPALEGAEDPVQRLAAGFETYCRVLDRRRLGALLTYRESGELDRDGRRKMREMELKTIRPLATAVEDGVRQGVFVAEDPELVAYSFVMVAHQWALKYWYLGQRMTLDDYIRVQFEHLLRGLLAPELVKGHPRYTVAQWTESRTGG